MHEPMSSAVTSPARSLTVVQLIPALHSGGAERSALEIGRALVQAGHRSVVISAGGRLTERLVAEGSEHITLDIGRKSLATLAKLGALRAYAAATASGHRPCPLAHAGVDGPLGDSRGSPASRIS